MQNALGGIKPGDKLVVIKVNDGCLIKKREAKGESTIAQKVLTITSHIYAQWSYDANQKAIGRFCLFVVYFAFIGLCQEVNFSILSYSTVDEEKPEILGYYILGSG